jgi:hypothetical protein
VVRRHLSAAQKREVIRQLREERPELSDRAVARMAGVDPKTVAEERRAQEDEVAEDTQPEAETVETVDQETGEVTTETIVRPFERPQRPREEATGRRARGRQPQSPVTRRRPREESEDEDEDRGEPFRGTILPSATKVARVAEARRCLKHLGLTVADLTSRRRGAAA